MHASQVAIRNHQKEKLEALRNAVLNAALSNAPDEDLQLMFLIFVDSLTPLHIKALKLIYDKKPLTGLSGFESHHDFYEQIKQDLMNRGLVPRYSGMSLNQIFEAKAHDITKLGEQFLKFITAPT
jgi:hypothetical protein